MWALHGCLTEQQSTKCNLCSGSEMPATTPADKSVCLGNVMDEMRAEWKGKYKRLSEGWRNKYTWSLSKRYALTHVAGSRWQCEQGNRNNFLQITDLWPWKKAQLGCIHTSVTLLPHGLNIKSVCLLVYGARCRCDVDSDPHPGYLFILSICEWRDKVWSK